MEKIKKEIEWLLKESGLSNYKISKGTGISEVMLGRYSSGKVEVGRMSLDNAIKLHTYFVKLAKERRANASRSDM